MLLQIETWKQRDAAREKEDTEAQQKLVDYLQKNHTAQAEAIKRDVGCLRFRSEEVAAASGLSLLPAEYAVVAPIGKALMKKVPA